MKNLTTSQNDAQNDEKMNKSLKHSNENDRNENNSLNNTANPYEIVEEIVEERVEPEEFVESRKMVEMVDSDKPTEQTDTTIKIKEQMISHKEPMTSPKEQISSCCGGSRSSRSNSNQTNTLDTLNPKNSNPNNFHPNNFHESNENNENNRNNRNGIWASIFYGLIPHTGCIAFILFTILGVTAATSFLKPFLLNAYIFYVLIFLSFVFTTISAIIYLKKHNLWSLDGLKLKWKYLLTMYSLTLGINLLLFMVVFPLLVNIPTVSADYADYGVQQSQLQQSGLQQQLNSSNPQFNPTQQLNQQITGAVVGVPAEQALNNQLTNADELSTIRLKVGIPCPGHASLISQELKSLSGIKTVKFSFPNLFDVTYNPTMLSKEDILSLDVFNTYKANIINGPNFG